MNIDTLQITPEILALISEVDEFKGAWRALGNIAPEQLSSLRQVATIESIGSSTSLFTINSCKKTGWAKLPGILYPCNSCWL